VATGSWLRTHRKQVIIHTSIVVAFILFLFFLAGPLFDKFEATIGISMLHDISLPGETDNIMCGLTRHTIDTATIQLDGWAFIEGHGAENKETFIVLKSNNRVYVFDTVYRRRSDIASQFDRPDLMWSGFMAVIPSGKIRSGEYSVGLYIRGDDTEALEFTDWVLKKSAGEVHLAL
jgi:hypothetical protein